MRLFILKKRVVAPLLTALAIIVLTMSVNAEESKPAEAKSAPSTSARAEAAPQQSPTTVLATVNGTAITRAELDRAMQVLIAQNRITQKMDAGSRKQAEDAALDQLIHAEVAYQAGLKLEIKDLDKQIADKVAQGKARFPSPAEYEAALKANNLTDKELQELVRKDVVIGNLFQKEVVGKITVTEADARKFYNENKDKFKQPESYHASHILIGVKPEDKPEDKQKAREKAEAIRKKIVAGEDFAALAKTESSCPSSKQGGDLGFFGAGEMVPAFEKATAALKPGEISPVVETQFGYHIIKLVEKKAAGNVEFDSVKGEIENYLKQTMAQKALGDYVDVLKSSAKIVKTGK